MTSKMKKMAAGVLAGVILVGSGLTMAAASGHGMGRGPGMGMGQGMGPGMAWQDNHHQPMMDLDSMAKRIADEFGVDQSEVRAALNNRRDFRDIGQAAMLAKISGKSFQEVLAMKTSWWDVAKSLGVTRDQMKSAVREHIASHIAQQGAADKDQVLALLADGYQARDIGFAARLAKASDRSLEDVLAMKRINNRWMDVARELNVGKNTLPPGEAPDEEDGTELILP